MQTISIFLNSALVYITLVFAIRSLISFRTKRVKSLFFIMLFFTALSLFFTIQLFHLNDYISIVRYLFPFVLPVFLMILPSFYLFMIYITDQKINTGRILKHYVPSLFYLFLLLPFLFFDKSQQFAFLQKNYTQLGSYLLIIRYLYLVGVTLLIFTQFILYFYFFIKFLTHFDKKIENHFSSKENLTINWAFTTVLLFFVLFIILNFSEFFGIKDSIIAKFIFDIIVGFIVFYIYENAERLNYTALNQLNTISSSPKNEEDSVKEFIERVKYKTSALNQIQKENLINKLENLKKSTELLDPDLTLNALAHKLETNTTYLSQVINEHYNCNFFQFINNIRVQRAKEMLLNPSYSKYTIDAIAELCGFKSRSSFYEAFKKQYGTTPTQYKKNFSKVS